MIAKRVLIWFHWKICLKTLLTNKCRSSNLELRSILQDRTLRLKLWVSKAVKPSEIISGNSCKTFAERFTLSSTKLVMPIAKSENAPRKDSVKFRPCWPHHHSLPSKYIVRQCLRFQFLWMVGADRLRTFRESTHKEQTAHGWSVQPSNRQFGLN